MHQATPIPIRGEFHRNHGKGYLPKVGRQAEVWSNLIRIQKRVLFPRRAREVVASAVVAQSGHQHFIKHLISGRIRRAVQDESDGLVLIPLRQTQGNPDIFAKRRFVAQEQIENAQLRNILSQNDG